MGRKITFTLIFICWFLNVNSQNQSEQFIISGGATYSIFRGVNRIPFRDYETKFDFTIGQQLNFDFAVLRRLSFGLGLVHHKHKLNIYDYKYFKGPAIITENPTHTVSAYSANLRMLIHMKSIFDDTGEQLDVYWGGHSSFVYYSSSNNSTDPDFFTLNESIPNFIALVGGIRYYPIDQFGLHFETSLVGPYTCSAGIIFRSFTY